MPSLIQDCFVFLSNVLNKSWFNEIFFFLLFLCFTDVGAQVRALKITPNKLNIASKGNFQTLFIIFGEVFQYDGYQSTCVITHESVIIHNNVTVTLKNFSVCFHIIH